MSPETKRCARCEATKSVDAFYRKRSRHDSYCKECRKAQAREWGLQNRVSVRERGRRKRLEHPEREREYQLRYGEKHPGRRLDAVTAWAQRNPEKIKAQKAVANAVRRGKLAKPNTCEGCGFEAEMPRELDAHHHDYSKPLEVRWLCRRCHKARHRQ